MILYCGHQRKLAEPQKDGNTYRQHLQAAAKKTSEAARRELAGPEMPEELTYIWAWFLDLHAARSFTLQETGARPLPIAWMDIQAYVQLTGNAMSPWEVQVLRALDARWLAGPKEPAP